MQAESPNNEKELLARIAEGDERAFTQLVQHWWQPVFFHASTYIKSTQSAEEITLDIFEKIWHKRIKLKEVERFQDWLFIVTKNELIARLRKKIVDNKLDRPDLVAREDIHFPGKALEMQELTSLIERGVEQLTRQQREIFQLSRKEGLSHIEIAEKLGLSRQTVKGHIVNALNFLRKFLKDNGEFFGLGVTVLLQLYRF